MLACAGIGVDECGDGLFEVGVRIGDWHLVIPQAQCHVPGTHAGDHGDTGRAQGSEVHVPQPAHVAAVGIFVVDGDHGVRVGRVEAGEREAEAHRVLDQQQFDRGTVDVDDLATAESRRDAGNGSDKLVGGHGAGVGCGGGLGCGGIVLHHRTYHSERGGRVVQVVDAFKLDVGGVALTVHLEGGLVVAHGGKCHVGGKFCRACGSSSQFASRTERSSG